MALENLTTFLLIALSASSLMASEDNTKNDTASNYGAGPAQPYQAPPPFFPPIGFPPMFGPPVFPTLLDDHICDDRAGVLITNFEKDLVNNAPSGGYGGNGAYDPAHGPGPHHGPHHGPFNPFHMHGNSRRFMCADIAATDLHSCNVCCRIAPRIDRSIKEQDVYGVIVDTLQLAEPNDNNEGHAPGGSYRKKRYSGVGADPEIPPPVAPAPPDFVPKVPAKNLKCICCMPRRRTLLPVPGPFPPPPPPAFPIFPHFPQYPQFQPGFGPQGGYGQAPQSSYSQPSY
uniref:Uncharacterized protein n=1 Tax=Strongyloides venezuelensis TaxID=75913 RepID=A0A0K0FH15_STRVS